MGTFDDMSWSGQSDLEREVQCFLPSHFVLEFTNLKVEKLDIIVSFFFYIFMISSFLYSEVILILWAIL